MSFDRRTIKICHRPLMIRRASVAQPGRAATSYHERGSCKSRVQTPPEAPSVFSCCPRLLYTPFLQDEIFISQWANLSTVNPRGLPSQVKGAGLRLLSRRGSWVRIPPPAPPLLLSGNSMYLLYDNGVQSLANVILSLPQS